MKSTTARLALPLAALALIAAMDPLARLPMTAAGRNGAYTSALLQHLSTSDCSIESMFKRVRNTLSTATGGKQISWEHTSLAGDFFFNLSQTESSA